MQVGPLSAEDKGATDQYRKLLWEFGLHCAISYICNFREAGLVLDGYALAHDHPRGAAACLFSLSGVSRLSKLQRSLATNVISSALMRPSELLSPDVVKTTGHVAVFRGCNMKFNRDAANSGNST